MREILIDIITWLIPFGFISLLVLNTIASSIKEKMGKQQKEKNHEEQKKENPPID